MKPITKDQFSLWTMGAGICIISHCVAKYKPILSYLSEYNLHHFTFSSKTDELIKAVI